MDAVVNTHRHGKVSEALYCLARCDQMSDGWAESTCGLVNGTVYLVQIGFCVICRSAVEGG